LDSIIYSETDISFCSDSLPLKFPKAQT